MHILPWNRLVEDTISYADILIKLEKATQSCQNRRPGFAESMRLSRNKFQYDMLYIRDSVIESRLQAKLDRLHQTIGFSIYGYAKPPLEVDPHLVYATNLYLQIVAIFRSFATAEIELRKSSSSFQQIKKISTFLRKWREGEDPVFTKLTL